MHRDILILRNRTATHPNGSNEVPTRIEDRLSTAKHDGPTVCLLDRIDIATRFAAILQRVAGDAVVENSGFGFLLRDVLFRGWGVINMRWSITQDELEAGSSSILTMLPRYEL